MKMWMGGEEVFIEVVSFYEYPRNAAGFCALCNGDPCNENSPPDSLIARFYAHEPDAETCPVCDGRPT